MRIHRSCKVMFLAVIWFSLIGVLLMPFSASAQGRFEVTPFAGYETGSQSWVSVHSGGPAGIVAGLRANAGLAIGSFVDYRVSEKVGLEFMWDSNPTSYGAPFYVRRPNYFKAFNSTIDQYQFGVLYTFLNREGTPPVSPYVTASVGFTQDANSILSAGASAPPNRGAFAWSIGGGLKYYLSRHIGFRGDFRYLPTQGGTYPTVYCNYCSINAPAYFYNGSYPSYLKRGNFVGGMIFRF